MKTRSALRTGLSVGLIAAVAAFRFAAAEQLPVKLYTTTDGLPSDRIHSILIDSRGFLWLGTTEGISRFDGYRFTALSSAEGMPGGSARAVVESRDGTYWAATPRGVLHWDPRRKGLPGRAPFSLIRLGGEDPDAEQARALAEEPSGAMWVATSRGLLRLTRSGSAWTAMRVRLARPDAPAIPESGYVNALAFDRSGNLWIAAEDGVYCRRPSGAVFRVGGNAPRHLFIRTVLVDRNGRIWAGSQHEGLLEIRDAGLPTELVRVAFSIENGLAGNHVTSLLESRDGKIWAGCFGGLSEISADRRFARAYSTAEGLSGTGIWSLAEDRSGNIWIGSDDAGIMRLSTRGFRRFDARDGLASTRVAALFEDRAGRLCAFTRGVQAAEIAVDDSYLECYDGWRFHSVRPTNGARNGFGWGVSQVTLQDSRGEWWIPTNRGLYRFPAVALTELDRAAPLRVYTVADGMAADNVFRLFEDRRGDIWIGAPTAAPCVVRWERSSGAIRPIPGIGAPLRLPMSFAEDRSGAIWIGFSNGLVRHGQGVTKIFGEADGLPRGAIASLHVDREGRLWVATDEGGVARVDRPESDKPTWRRIGMAEGLSSDDAGSLVEDREGRIYAGTDRGLDRIDPESNNVQHFTTDDGLARGIIETSWADRDGNLWFGSSGGLSRLDAGADPPRSRLDVRITRILVDGIAQPLPSVGAEAVSLSEFGSGSRSLQIDFAAIDFAPGGRPRYQYVLEGADRRWSEPAEDRSVVYARLPPGSFRFRVRAIGSDGRAGGAPAGVRFSVLPPLWQRPGVIAIAALAAGALAYALHRHRLRGVLAIERIRIRVATDLHDDVGAGLSEIAILSDLAGQEEGSGPGALLLEIGESARRLVDSMSDIVWSTDPRKDDLSSLAQRIRKFGSTTLERKGVVWSLEVPEEFEASPLDPERRRQLFLIVKEALTNIARHAECRSAGVRISPTSDEVSIEISDDGRGFSASGDPASGHGLANMTARARSLRGDLSIDSGPSGTRIRVRVPFSPGRRWSAW